MTGDPAKVKSDDQLNSCMAKMAARLKPILGRSVPDRFVPSEIGQALQVRHLIVT
jgi:hypothetical protein